MCLKNGVREGRQVKEILFSYLVRVVTISEDEIEITYANVHLNGAPEHEPGGVSIATNADDLDHAENGADGGEEAHEENSNEGVFAATIYLNLREKGDWDRKNYNIKGEMGPTTKPIKSRNVRKALAWQQRSPRLSHRMALEQQYQETRKMASCARHQEPPDEQLVKATVSRDNPEVSDAKSDFEAEDAQLVKRPSGEVGF
ncbi:MAG: hypothetical protein M1840_008345 [Geoglossum simile]|nr:MAG: hypothetical protein M1840_008345 [Geoglossum simile]